MRKLFFKLYFIISVLLILNSILLISNCYCQWVWQNPIPQGNGLRSSSFINDNTGWIVGLNGTILKTTNGGVNWNILQNGSTEEYVSVCFKDINNGWLLSKNNSGSSGQAFIKHTTNGGTSWFNQLVLGDSIQGADNIQFLDMNTGYALVFSARNYVFKTTNGGTNWNVLSSPTNIWMRKLLFKDENTGWICGEAGYIFRTTNGGVNWDSLKPPITHAYYGISFPDYNTGYVVGIFGYSIQKTTNGGTNWFLISQFPEFSFWDVNFINVNTGVAVGEGVILRTVNGGYNWDTLKRPDNTVGNEVYSNVQFNHSNNGWIVGSTGDILKSTNSGINWTSHRLGSVSNFYDIHFLDVNTGHIAGWSLLRTTNSGINWNIVADTGIYCSSFINSNTGWAGGRSNNCISTTTNGGINWSVQYSQVNSSCQKIHFSDINNGWAILYVGQVNPSCIIARTTNRGENWITNNYIGSSSNIPKDFFFINNQTGWVVGTGNSTNNLPSIISKTTNGGINWISQSVLNNYAWQYSVYFLNNNTGWITGDGIVLKTTNSGNNWLVLVTSSVYGYSISFFDENTGYIASSNGLFKSTNGGINWVFSKYNQSVGVRTSYFLNANTGWIAGYNGAILKTTNGGSVFINNISKEIPEGFSLGQNFPNPFNPKTVISFQLPVDSKVLIKVFDVLGREVETLVNERLQAGTYSTQWDASAYPSGVYFCRMVVRNGGSSTGDYSETRRMMLVR